MATAPAAPSQILLPLVLGSFCWKLLVRPCSLNRFSRKLNDTENKLNDTENKLNEAREELKKAKQEKENLLQENSLVKSEKETIKTDLSSTQYTLGNCKNKNMDHEVQNLELLQEIESLKKELKAC